MDINEVKEVWNRVKDELEVNVPEHIFGTWITPLEAVDMENNTAIPVGIMFWRQLLFLFDVE